MDFRKVLRPLKPRVVSALHALSMRKLRELTWDAGDSMPSMGERGLEETPRAPIISVHESSLFAYERKADRYICHVHFFIHNFSSEPFVASRLLLVVKGLALDPIERQPTWPVPFDANPVPFVIAPGHYREMHVYFDVGTILQEDVGELSIRIAGKTHTKRVKFTIAHQ